MKTSKDHLLGYCGLYCGNCGIYQNTIKGTKQFTDDGKGFECHGCNSSSTSPWCTDCAIRDCNKERDQRYCLKCGDYPCGMITGFMNDEKYPYHLEVEDMMKRLEVLGLDAWTEEMHKKCTCVQCGEKYPFTEKDCPHCKKRAE